MNKDSTSTHSLQRVILYVALFSAGLCSAWLFHEIAGVFGINLALDNEVLLVLLLLCAVFILCALVVGLFQARKTMLWLLGEANEAGKRRVLEKRLSLLNRYSRDIILITDSTSWQIQEANERACEFYGYTEEELRNRSVSDLCSQEAVKSLKEKSDALLLTGQLVYESEHLQKGGMTVPVEVSSQIVDLNGSKCHFATIRDLSVQKSHERELNRQKRLYSALVQVNQMMTHAGDEDELFACVCGLLADQGGFRLVWIGHCDSTTGHVISVAARGVEADFLSSFDIQIGDGPRYSTPTYVALREGHGDVCRDINEARMAPWRESLNRHDFHACAAFPIRRAKRVWGNLTVYSSDPETLGESECALLEETANNITYVLSVLDDKAARRRIEGALRESEQHFESLFQTVSEIVAIHEVVFDSEGKVSDYRITDCNPSFSNQLGIPRERAIGALASELYGTGHAPYLTEFTSVAITGEPYSFESFFAPLGKYFQISVVAPGPGQFATISSDITFRKQTENALRESESRFRSTFEQAATGIAHVSLDGKFLRVNQRLCDLLGFSAEELVHMHFQDITYAEDLPVDLLHLRELTEGKIPIYSREKRYLINGGKVLWAQLTVSLVHLSNGAPHYFIAVIQDIAQRKQAEDALRDSESRYRRLTQAVTDYVYSVQIRDGRPAETKHGAGCMAVTGYFPEEFERDSYLWLRMVVAEDRHIVLNQVESILGNKEAIPIEHRITRKDGTIRWVRNTPSAHRNAQGLLLSYDGLVQDITERKNADQQLREANAKLQTYATQMEVLVKGRTAELEATNRELEAFSYSVSHDLRAPLRAIDGFARILMEDYSLILDEEGRRLLKVVGSESQRMGRLIDDLLAFSRMGRHALKPIEIDIGPLVIEVRDELMAREPGRQIRWEISSLPKVWGDPVFLRQVLLNLMGNAMKYSRNRELAVIEIAGFVQGTEAIVYIRDNGAGFDMKYVGKLFGVFQRLHADAEFEGNGVGLALVQRIIHRHGGRVWAEGKRGEGAIFFFALPTSDFSHPGAI